MKEVHTTSSKCHLRRVHAFPLLLPAGWNVEIMARISAGIMDQARCDLGDNISYLLPHKKSPHNLAAYNNKHYLAVSVVRNSGMA